jgi:hypothetical protein
MVGGCREDQIQIGCITELILILINQCKETLLGGYIPRNYSNNHQYICQSNSIHHTPAQLLEENGNCTRCDRPNAHVYYDLGEDYSELISVAANPRVISVNSPSAS